MPNSRPVKKRAATASADILWVPDMLAKQRAFLAVPIARRRSATSQAVVGV
jgi:hypothetical protein